MQSHPEIAVEYRPYPFHSKGRGYTSAWFPPSEEPDGTQFGSAAICFTPDRGVVLGSPSSEKWEVPGGRPEDGEDWRSTLEREVMEEVCASIDTAKLLGFVRSECFTGAQVGRVLVRSVWAAQVTLGPWEPQHEIVHRRVFEPESVLGAVNFPEGQLPIYRRWLAEATGLMIP